MLWKNDVVTAGACAVAFALIFPLLASRLEKRWLAQLAVAAVLLAIPLQSSLPYAPTMLLLVVGALVLAAQGMPVIAPFILLTALYPIMHYFVGNVGSINRLIELSTPLIVGTAMGLYLLLAKPKGAVRREDRLIGWIALLFVLADAVLEARGYSATASIRTFLQAAFLSYSVYFVAARSNVDRPRLILAAFGFAGIALSLMALLEAFHNWPLFIAIGSLKDLPITNINLMTIRRNNMGRAAASFDDSIASSIFFMLVILAWFGLARWRGARALPSALGGAILFGGLWATQSRTGLLGLGVAAVAGAFAARRYLLGIALLAGGVILVQYRSLTMDAHQLETVEYRKQLLRVIPHYVARHPIVGDNHMVANGVLDELKQGQGIVDVVNTYLYMAVNGGLLLLLLFVALLWASWRACRSSARRIASADLARLNQVVGMQIVALAVALFTTSPTDKNLVYVLVCAGLASAIAWQSRNAPRAVPRPRKRAVIARLAAAAG